MKTSYNFFALAFFLLLSLSFCSEKEDPKPTPPAPTNLDITVRNSLGSAVNGAIVKLYSSITDYQNQTNQVGSTQVTNSNGVASFSNLNPIQYYWRAESGCRNNVNGSITTTTPLTANRLNQVNSIITETGTIQFISQSSNPYRLFINGVASGDLQGGASISFVNRPTGNYTLRVLQLSGFLITPTDQTYSGNLTCGNSLIVNFP